MLIVVIVHALEGGLLYSSRCCQRPEVEENAFVFRCVLPLQHPEARHEFLRTRLIWEAQRGEIFTKVCATNIR